MFNALLLEIGIVIVVVALSHLNPFTIGIIIYGGGWLEESGNE